jgi:hypothetical protein
MVIADFLEWRPDYTPLPGPLGDRAKIGKSSSRPASGFIWKSQANVKDLL